MKQLVEECRACQTHGNSQKSEPQRPALEYMDRPMQSIGLDFFHWKAKYYIILMDHFSGLPMIQMMRKAVAKEVISQLKNWFSTFSGPGSSGPTMACPSGPRISRRSADFYKYQTIRYNNATGGQQEQDEAN